MKKIGIISMQRVVNYGSFLQAYGLKKLIENNCDAEVQFVDFEPEKPIIDMKADYTKRILKNLNIIDFLKKRKVKQEFANRYNNEFLPILNVTSKKNVRPEEIETLVVGSDEVFNCLQKRYSMEFYGKGYEDKKVISYAGSFGHTTLEGLEKYNVKDEVGTRLNKFSNISVRDNNSFEIVKNITNHNPVLNLDPVLVSDFSEERRDNVKIKDYIIIYAYPGRLSKKEEKYIKNFAKKNNKKIISLGMYQRIADDNSVVHPFEIFDYFKHADFVITDTFHGSIFAIKTHTKFCTIIRNTNNNKLGDLIRRLDQEKQIARNVENIEEIYKVVPEFENSDKVIENEKQKSIEYLKNNI